MPSPHRKPIITKAAIAAAYVLLGPGNVDAAPSGSVDAKSRIESKTLYFSHQDERLLAPGQAVSSVAYLSRGRQTAKKSPLLVLLHGINESRTLYPWFGGTHDLRPMLNSVAAERNDGFIVAAPTQTKNAWLPRNMWANFDLKAFVDDLRLALPNGYDIDPNATYIAGHSAAGCNPNGGLTTCTEVAAGVAPAGLAFIDTCFDIDVATRFAVNLSETKVWVLWQNLTWRREPEPFIAAIPGAVTGAVRLIEFQPKALNPHVDVMYSAVEMLVREWLIGNAEQPIEQKQDKDPPPSPETTAS